MGKKKKDIKKKKRIEQQKKNIAKKRLETIRRNDQITNNIDVADENEKIVASTPEEELILDIPEVDEIAEETTASNDVLEETTENIEKITIENSIEKELKEDNKKIEKKCKAKKIKEKKRFSKKGKIMLCVVLMLIIIALVCLVYLAVRPKFKDITIELGTTDISAENFLVSSIYKKGASIVTDLNSIDLLKVQEIEIELEFRGKREKVKLNIVDTTAPTVEFKNMMAYLDYVPNPEDFVKSKNDLSEMKVEFVEVPQFTDYGTYFVNTKVSDIYGNETIGKSELMITWLIQEVSVELGSEFSVANVVIDTERFGALVPETELAKVNNMVLGTYEINVDIEGKNYTSKVVVQDTTPPVLQLKNITIWDDEKVGGFENFIVSASDISGEVKTESSSVIDYKIIGDQPIVIKATDVNGNVTEQTATLTIKHDTTGPVINGLSNLTVNKHSTVNYESGVSAVDNKDGKTTFNVDSSAVNMSAAGTYYATYSAVDSAGNRSSYKRKVTVNWDSEDVNQKINEFYNNYCAGQSPAGIAQIVASKVKYNATNYGSRDANIYYGLTKGGNCFVHAYILQALINKSGSSCSIIRLSDGAHCWNKVGSVHYDSTPGGRHFVQANSDEEKLSEPWFSGKSYTAEQFVY